MSLGAPAATGRGGAGCLRALSVVLLGLALVGGFVPSVHASNPLGPPKTLLAIHESGLPGGLPWVVEINSAHYEENQSTLDLQVPPQNYFITIPPVGQYQANNSFFQEFVGVAPVYVNFTFVYNNSFINDSGNNTTNATGLFGLPPGEGDFLVLVIALAVIAVAAVLLIRTRGRKRKAPAPEDSEASEGPKGRPKAPKGKGRSTKDERKRAQRRRAERESEDDGPAGDE